MSDEQRFAHLESSVAFQEATLLQLNQVVIRQQAQIDRLETQLGRLMERSGPLVRDAADEEAPPHY